MKKYLILILLLLGILLFLESANTRSAQQIPFQIDRNKVILAVRVNDSRPLKIILDSGMPSPGVILFKKELGEELNLVGAERYQIRGAGKGKESYAIRAESQNLKLGDVEYSDQRVLVLQSDTFKGFPTDGVMGNTFQSETNPFSHRKSVISMYLLVSHHCFHDKFTPVDSKKYRYCLRSYQTAWMEKIHLRDRPLALP